MHLHYKSNCPECKSSKGEEEISLYLINHQISYIFQYKVNINNSNHYFDFYLPGYNTIVEFNGMQHYKPIEFFGGEKDYEILRDRDSIKKSYCEANGVNLLVISYNEDIKCILNKLFKNKSKNGNQ